MHSEWPGALLFDMDGLTVDTEPIWFQAEQAVAAEIGGRWAESNHLACVGGPVEKMARLLGRSAGAEDHWEQIADSVISRAVELIPQNLTIKPGVEALIDQARTQGLPVALVSGSPRIIVDAVVSSIGIDYKVIVSGDDVQANKPDPEPYLKAVRTLGMEVDECLALEDSPTGARSAAGAGLSTLVIPSVPVAPSGRQVQLPSLEGISLERIRALFEYLT